MPQAITNNLLIFDESGSNKMADSDYADAPQRLNGVQASQVISSLIHNTTLRSLTLIQKAMIDSLLSNAVAGSEGVPFTTNISSADAKSNFDTLFGRMNVFSASKWTTSRNFTITDGHGHTGLATSVNGGAAVSLRLPSTIQVDVIGSLTGTASNAAKINNKSFDMTFDAQSGTLSITYQ